ncbi:regulator of ribonuclease activity A [Geodermatophilus dictyosporus]|uniref:4-hydroxy-4-methyl-2-oxoglutarate aldolase n=1 Tax=Geodermatophilus dictyosporus TaxID=1523247 RepID=A0A1I5R1Z4_9ACTN|nr:ribonuclease E activity regulator RraA [Geodermatophilus dictyosporus]SFP52548.1 regulator of ribonuclease activity A [Geodermatophilus dictyosporus]
MSRATTDICDEHPEAQVCDAGLAAFGGRPAFSGTISTLKVFEDNTLVRDAVGQPGEGRVLVVDGGGSLRCALLGGNLAVAAAENGWAGVVVNGAVRDADEIDAQPIGVRALATHPRRSVKGLHSGQAGLPVVFAGVVFREGEWLCADRDGVVVLPSAPGTDA